MIMKLLPAETWKLRGWNALSSLVTQQHSNDSDHAENVMACKILVLIIVILIDLVRTAPTWYNYGKAHLPANNIHPTKFRPSNSHRFVEQRPRPHLQRLSEKSRCLSENLPVRNPWRPGLSNGLQQLVWSGSQLSTNIVLPAVWWKQLVAELLESTGLPTVWRLLWTVCSAAGPANGTGCVGYIVAVVTVLLFLSIYY